MPPIIHPHHRLHPPPPPLLASRLIPDSAAASHPSARLWRIKGLAVCRLILYSQSSSSLPCVTPSLPPLIVILVFLLLILRIIIIGHFPQADARAPTWATQGLDEGGRRDWREIVMRRGEEGREGARKVEREQGTRATPFGADN